MDANLGIITSIKVVENFSLEIATPHEGSKGAREGMIQMMNRLSSGISDMDGYKVETTEHTFLVLIDNGQSCCESWGYIASEDNLEEFVGNTLLSVKLTDKALNQRIVEKSGEYGSLLILRLIKESFNLLSIIVITATMDMAYS